MNHIQYPRRKTDSKHSETVLGATGAAGIGMDALVTTGGALYAGQDTDASGDGAIYTPDSSRDAGTVGPVITPFGGNVPFELAPSFAVPQPSAWTKLAIGLTALGFARRRRRRTALSVA
jgi:hypothetical protein